MSELNSKNWKQLTAIFIGIGMFGIMVGTFIPSATAGISGFPCDSGEGTLEHWDKIVFSSPGVILDPFDNVIPKNELLDVKVGTTNPAEVMDLRQEVVDALNNQGFTRSNDAPLAKHLIVIDDVEYAIGCFNPGVPQV